MDPSRLISKKAKSLGFDAVGFTAPEAVAQAGDHLESFVGESRHGDMVWLAERIHERKSPANLWPDVKSVVALAMNYGPETDPLDNLKRKGVGNLSVYARGKDYHDILKSRVKALARWIHETMDGDVKVFVDTAPVMEKPLAQAAGIGWQGKHTNLISRAHGSWLFLAEIYTTLDLEPGTAESDHCGACRWCLDVCPTNAFPAPYQLDARRCISYLTIEHKGHIALEFRAAMGNRIYGCDDCLAVCPWNKFAAATHEPGFLPRAELSAPRLADLAGLDDAEFRRVFSGSPIKRTGRDRFVRNVLIAIGNSGEPGLAQVAEARLTDASPLVRAMAVWALSRLADAAMCTRLRNAHRPTETDEHVRAEWDAVRGAVREPIEAY